MNFSFFVLLITDSVKKGGLYSQPIARLMKDHLCQVRAIATPEISHRPQNVFWLQIQNFMGQCSFIQLILYRSCENRSKSMKS